MNVIKPGAEISAVITDFLVHDSVKPGEIVHFVLSIKIDGNVFTTANSNVIIYRGDEKTKSIKGLPAELNVGEEKSIDLFWDASGFAEWKYTAIAELNNGEKVSKSMPMGINLRSKSTIPGFSSLITMAAIIVIAVILFRIGKENEKRQRHK